MALLILHQFNKNFYVFLNISFLCLLCFYLIILFQYPPPPSNNLNSISAILDDSCNDIHRYIDPQAKCQYVKSDKGCHSKGYIDYLQLFYCSCEKKPVFGYILLLLWLVLLFYLLANTAANYFCSSLESLSKILKLSPTIAGVTLLSLGNGAPDVFSSVVSFMGTGNSGGVGFNSILGGAFVVSSVVVGVISISISPRCISVDKFSFVRDVLFFIFTLCSLLVIFIVGRINIWGSLAFVSLYLVYVFIVSTSHFCMKMDDEVNLFAICPITRSSLFIGDDVRQEFTAPLLTYVGDEEKSVPFEGGNQNSRRRRRMCGYLGGRVLFILELPLYLPRRMTIPVVCEERWSKPFAVISVTLAPILLATLWDSQRANWGYGGSIVIYLIGGLMGIVFGTVTFVTTKNSNPPRKCLLPWLIGGFLMSVTWTYIIAQELVSLLISLGHIFGISPSILGLTLLAWGNSLGDLIANVAMAMNGGESDGAQIAISGCYAGPIFNILVGLGVSLVFSSWAQYPESYIIPKDPSLYETTGFLIVGLLWALVILPKKNMKLDKFLGIGLLAIYFCFLCVRLAQTTLMR